jgi:ribonuclease HII
VASAECLIEYDRALGAVVCGADEVGRGCLAGPIVAAAVRFDYDRFKAPGIERLAGLDDSKKLSLDSREAIYGAILEIADATAVVVRSPRWIDAQGLHRTNLEIVASALDRVWLTGAVALSDGFAVKDAAGASRAVVKGDATSAAIAAASVVAKVTRDRMMRLADKRFPEYGFAKHVGYATAKHRDAIVRNGPTPLHRMSFASVAYEQLSLGS